MGLLDELIRAFDHSLILSCWKYIFPVLVVLYMFIFLYDKHRYGGKKSKITNVAPTVAMTNEVKEKLDGMEYVGEIDSGEFDPTPVLEEKEHIPFSGAMVTLDSDPLKAASKFYEIVNDRRSVRKFSSRPVDLAVVEKCIHAAGTSPSGAHTEPWTFCLVSNADVKEQIREIIEAEELVNYQQRTRQRMSKQWTTDLRPLKTNHVKEYLTEAPHLVLIFKQTYGFKEDGAKKQHYYNEISTSIATGILLCALQVAGLNSLVTTPLNCGPALRNLLGRPVNEKLLVLLPVGYAAEDCTVPDLQRKPVEEILVKY